MPTGAIVGGVVGGIAFLALIGLCLVLLLRRRRRHTVQDIDLLDDTPLGGDATPFVTSSVVSPYTFVSSHYQHGLPPSAVSLSADTISTSFVGTSFSLRRVLRLSEEHRQHIVARVESTTSPPIRDRRPQTGCILSR